MVNLVRKDLLILKRYLWLAPLYGLFALYAFRTMLGGALSVGTVVVTYMLMLQAITQDDKNNSEIMLNSLPLRRKDIVLAKYLSVFLYAALVILFFLLARGVVTVIGIGMIPILISPISLEEIASALVAMVILISIYLPIYFKFGYLRSRMVGSILFIASIFLLPMVSIMHVYDRGTRNSILRNIIALLGRLGNWLQTQADWQIASYMLALALTLTTASVFLSLRFYARREF
ncbi:MAG: ABC-2 transporter permease [Desulfosporosinus sp.]|nr:ABC-2 transporter permease [Desulfosporosinus sp.]